jgi:hypothetical protein
MEHKIISNENYFFALSNDLLKDGDLVVSIHTKKTKVVGAELEGRCSTEWKKIVGQFPLGDAPFLDGVAILPMPEPKHYTEEDIIFSITKAISCYRFDDDEEDIPNKVLFRVKTNKTPKAFKGDMKTLKTVEGVYNIESIVPVVKTNPVTGKAEWVGEYIY